MESKTSSTQRGGYSGELESWLVNRALLMGERSTFSGIVAAIEKGGDSGNSGTKGCGVKRVEPFENWKSLPALHRAFDRDARCEAAFRALTTQERWFAAARYCAKRESYPAGLHGQLGDLAAVAVVVAASISREMLRRFLDDASRGRSKGWEDIACKACEEMHKSWAAARVEVDSDIAQQGEE